MADEENAQAAEDAVADTEAAKEEALEDTEPVDAPTEDITPGPVEEGDEPSPEVKDTLSDTEIKPEDEIRVESRKTGQESLESDKLIEKRQYSIKEEVMPLFDSKGSLLATESYAKKRLSEFKKKRAAFVALTNDFKAKVETFKRKSNPTNEDIANMNRHHTGFLKRLSEYEEMTREVVKFMGLPSQINMADLPSRPTETPPQQEPSKDLANIEDKLPKIIVCGTDIGNSVPRIIVCEPLNSAHTEPFHGQSDKPKRSDIAATSECEGVVKEKLKETQEAKQKLATENNEINKMKLKLQQELCLKQEELENMKQHMMAYESENCRIQNENFELQKKLMVSGQGESKICKRELYMMYKGQSPEGTQGSCAGNIQNLMRASETMEEDVDNIGCQQEILQEDNICPGYASPRKPICKRMLPQMSTQTDEDKERDIYFESDKDPKYKELREQYQRLHNDFKNKVAEVASLRVDLEKTRTELNDITILHHELEAQHQQELENNSFLLAEKNDMLSSRGRVMELEQAANFAKQMYVSSSEELEGMKALVLDLTTQLDEYRNKYLNTLQIAEELKKTNEFMEIEYANNMAVEIQNMKLEMQEHLKELVPIKELLKVTQQKLKETEQMHKIALETIAQLSEKLETTLTDLETARLQMKQSGTGSDVVENLQHSLEVAEKKLTELERESDQLKGTMTKLEQLQSEQNQLLEKKNHEVQQLLSQLETLREESARQVSRLKERNEMTRKCLHAQIAEMEEEVARCRADTSCANKERDKIRSKLQLEICLLSENFRESQNRIIQLQKRINCLSATHPSGPIEYCQGSL